MEGIANQTEESNKGLKAGQDLSISDGTITISALDDALRSNNTSRLTAVTCSRPLATMAFTPITD